jgi:ATP-dependent Clp protease ATP-binding subunit ClpC
VPERPVICDRCRVRPAVATVRHITGGQPPVVADLCEACLAEGRRAAPRLGPFDEFFARFFEDLPAARPESGVPLRRPVQQVDITRYFSEATRRILRGAAELAVRSGSDDIDTDHLLWGMIEDPGSRPLLERVGLDVDALREEVQARVPGGAGTTTSPRLAPDTKRVLLAAFEEARQLGDSYIGPEHVLLGLARDADSSSGELLRGAGAPHDVARRSMRGPAPQAGGGGAGRGRRPPSRTPALDQFGRDLTALAEEGRLDPVVGRADEIEQAIEILSRRTKNNPVLIGDPGVGKTAVVEGIAQCIVGGNVPETIAGRRLVALDLAGMLAGTRHRGDFEERMRAIIDEAASGDDAPLLFIDELHTVVGAGAAEGAMDAANMLKPALARGELHVVGATTLDEYRRHIERDAALERRFQPVTVDEPSVDETVQILVGLRDRYEAFHRVRISDDALVAAAELSDRYVSDRFLPDKAIDLVDQAAARVRLRGARGADTRELEDELAQLRREKDQCVASEHYERAAELKEEIARVGARLDERRQERRRAAEVTVQDIAEVVSRATGVPVAQLTQLERDRLLHLEEQLHERVVGQDEAVRAVAEAVRRNRAGLGDPDRPIGGFLFLGPTGVGKTELAKALAASLFGDEDLMVRFDMSEFQERHTVSRLVGSPPGYVGYEEAGQLTERVRRRPYTVILLDEVEKAHPDVANILLQILDDGRLTDAHGRTVDFRNTVVIMTSNLGAERLQRTTPLGFRAETTSEEAAEQVEHDVLQELRRSFRPEFLNRIDEIVVFRPLTRDQVREIAGLLLRGLVRRLEARRIHVDVDDAAIDHLAAEGFDPEFGARPLRRTIQRTVENQLSRRVLAGEIEEGDRVTVGVADGELTIDVDRGGNDGEELDDWIEGSPGDEPEAGPGAPRLSA